MMEYDRELLGLRHIQQINSHSPDEAAFALGLILLCLENVTIICYLSMTNNGAP